VLNRSPILAVKDVTPQEAWSGVKPTAKHFRVFGCISYAYIPNAKRTKLTSKSLLCVLLGVSEESKAYRLYDHTSKRIVVSRDVIFKEEKQWEWDKSFEEQILVDLEWGDDEACDDLIEDDVVISEEDSNENVGMVNGEPNSILSNASIEASNASTEENLNEERRRIQRAPAYLNDYVTGEGFSDEDIEVNMAQIVSADPSSFEEAKKSSKWSLAMDAKMQAIKKNKTWQLTELPVGAKKIGVKWIYKIKFNELGEVDKYKARLVAKGYSQ